jgi:hypothetical protein
MPLMKVARFSRISKTLCQTAFLFVSSVPVTSHHLQLVPSEKYSYLLHNSTPARVSISSAAAAAVFLLASEDRQKTWVVSSIYIPKPFLFFYIIGVKLLIVEATLNVRCSCCFLSPQICIGSLALIFCEEFCSNWGGQFLGFWGWLERRASLMS